MDVRPIDPPQPVGSVERVAPIGVGTPHAEPDIAAAFAAIIDIAALPQMSLSDMGQLIRILDPPSPPDEARQTQELLRSAIAAARTGDVTRSLELLAQFVSRDPSHAQMLRTEPGLGDIRAQVNHLLIRLETVAGLDAETRITEATQALELPGPHIMTGWDTQPQVLLTMANRLYDAGGYVNYVHAASLAQLVVVEISRAPVRGARKRPASSRVAPDTMPKPGWPGLKALWLRAPLLILLVSWFLLGLVASVAGSILHYFWPAPFTRSLIDAGFTVWGIGFPALIVYGFWRRVRHIRFR